MFPRSALTVLVLLTALALSGCTGAGSRRAPSSTPSTSSPVPVTTDQLPTPSTTVVPTPPPSTAPATTAAAPKTVALAPAPAAAQALPLSFATGSATEVITVVARSTGSTTATLQRWSKSGSGWLPIGSAVAAYIGSAGLTTHPSESISATPIGSFGLTRAFGSLANPGTAISYHQTTSADWWISQYGGSYASIYNTMQTCSSSCPFALGDPNEHLAAITPEYRYAVVIDYNTTPPVVQGGGSAFFLHVANGAPTAGCVAIPQASLVAVMQWLNPAASPRILIGTA